MSRDLSSKGDTWVARVGPARATRQVITFNGNPSSFGKMASQHMRRVHKQEQFCCANTNGPYGNEMMGRFLQKVNH